MGHGGKTIHLFEGIVAVLRDVGRKPKSLSVTFSCTKQGRGHIEGPKF